MFKISGDYKFWVLYLKIFQIFSSEIFSFSKNRGEKFEKSYFLKHFQNKLYFIMSNVNSECLQLSFDVHIVQCKSKIMNFQKLSYQKLENFRGQTR